MPTAIGTVLASATGAEGHAAPPSQREGDRSEQGRIAGTISSYFWSDPVHKWYHYCGYGKADRNHEVGIGESLDLRFPIGHLPQFLERCGLGDHRIAPGLDVMAGHPVQPAGELGIREIQMFGDAQEMQILSVVDDGREADFSRNRGACTSSRSASCRYYRDKPG
jgi:hypothetical protein